jgi:hypothetical protein
VKRGWLVAVAVVLALASCQGEHVAGAQPVQYNLDEAFLLGDRQRAVIRGQNLELEFAEVMEDSRCPTKVECFWTGQARIGVRVWGRGVDTPITVEFNTNPAPGQTKQVVTVDGYTIRLRSLDPYPDSPERSIPLEDYRATLVVQKA